jgi:hypothetical protein
MPISGTVMVRCPGCQTSHEASLVQSINARNEPALVERLVTGDLNILACACGRRTLLEATLLYHDPDRAFFCQACPGGEAAMADGARAFATIASAQATRRLVPSHNALLEKVLISRADLDDAVIETLKVLLLASRGDDLDRVLLFAAIDREAGHLLWRLPDQQRTIASPLDGYTKLAASRPPSPGDELRVDRAWAIEAARRLTESGS